MYTHYACKRVFYYTIIIQLAKSVRVGVVNAQTHIYVYFFPSKMGTLNSQS